MNSPSNLLPQIHEHLSIIYDEQTASIWADSYKNVLDSFIRDLSTSKEKEEKKRCIEEHSSLLITYADSLKEEGKTPLAALCSFLSRQVGGAISTVHLLPFFPYSSDDGFSVIDPVTVNPEVGSWDDISRLGRSYRMMFDLVANHLSQYSEWIQKYLDRDPDFADFAIEVSGKEDISQVFRPRALPLFSHVTSKAGNTRRVWTTFSADQIDINYGNPKVLLTILDVLLSYIRRGASLVRLDAIAFIWKELGTSCIHHEKTHRIIQFFRWVLDTCTPGAGIITETNVPHKENISYFGNGHNEASLVYNFPLPPLTLHTFLTGDTTKLSEWASTLEFPSEEVTYFNFLASHDGIGVVPAQGILTPEEIISMAEHVQAQGGFVSYRSEGDGSKSPYELNCSYLSALCDASVKESTEKQAQRFIASQAIMLSLRGIPGIYIHSLLGSQNCHSCPDILNHPRRINREKLDTLLLERELNDSDSLRSQVLSSYLTLLDTRRMEDAFHPSAAQTVLTGNPSVFTLLRTAEKGESILTLINVTDQTITVDLMKVFRELSVESPERIWKDLLSDISFCSEENESSSIKLTPYQVCWLRG
ncbi:MAG: alpha-amylase [Sphaerochaetaceae bacterium]|nr:alpha-amylase [Sphaerochaetaceae bacterium]